MSTGWISSETLFPYGGAIAISPGFVIPYDLQIVKANPAIEFLGSEPNAVYQETREVAGDWWFATNATFEAAATPNEWAQVTVSVASYATVLRSNGSMQRLQAPAGAAAPIAWNTLWTIDALGGMASTPRPFTTNSELVLSATPTWNSPGSIMAAERINVTDTASSAASLFEDFQIAGVSKWSIRKDGKLTVGLVDNVNVGALGFYPSQLLPTTAAQATFGSTATGVSFKFLANDATANGLIVSSVSGATANTLVVNMGATQNTAGLLVNGVASITGALLQLDLTSGGTHALLVSATGNVTLGAGALQVNAGFINAGSGNAGTNGDAAFGRSTSTGAIFLGGSVSEAQIDWNITTATQVTFSHPGTGFAAITAGPYTNSSDATLKTNIQPLSLATPLVMALKPVSFNWIETDAPSLGFLAQDVQAVLPDLVSTSKGGLMGVNYDGIIPVLVRAFQELNVAYTAYAAAHP